MNINGINIDIMGNQQNNYAQQMLQICASHPECKDCPYVGQPVQMKDAVQICEIGINKQKQGET